MRSRIIFISAVILSVSLAAYAQGNNQSATGRSTSAPPPEVKLGAYIASGSIEAGYRFTDVTGHNFACTSNPSGVCNYTGMWDTLEDLRQGPRILEQTFNLRAPGNTGVLFDNMSFSSFGWGGDPENVARLRLNKHGIYDFAGLFRRDYQRFDYNLLANPLNPTVQPFPFLSLQSPHLYDTVRRMSDFSLTLLPQRAVSIRLGYDRLRVEGDSFFTFHMPRGTDIQPQQPWNVTGDGFRVGFDVRMFPKTVVSFDQSFRWLKNDNFQQLVDFPFTVNGVPTNLGISFNPASASPCAAPFIGAAVNPNCNQGLSYIRQDRYRSFFPTSQLSLHTSVINRVDFNARASYSWGDADSRFIQDWIGVTGTGRRQLTVGAPHGGRIITGVDFGATLHLTDSLRINEQFRFTNAREPMATLQTQTTFPRGAVTPTPTGPAVVTEQLPIRGLFQNIKQNQVELEADLGRFFGGHIGYRYTIRNITEKGEGFDVDLGSFERTLNEDETGGATWELPAHTGLAGIWIQPSDKFRLNFDTELTSQGTTLTASGNELAEVIPNATGTVSFSPSTFTRITPKHEQQYTTRATIQAMRNVTLTASGNILEQRNNLQTVSYRFHNRTYGFTTDVTPNANVLLDFAYNYQDVLQNALMCYVATPNILGAGACPSIAGYIGFAGDYSTQTHFGSAMIRVKPVRRVTTSLGYSIVSNDGGYSRTNPLLPIGPFQFNYHRPLAALEIEMAKGLALKGAYNYYGYNEKGLQPGPTLPRDFHTNVGTLSVRYAF